MDSRIKLLGHAPHPMLVMFPLGALGFSVASDALHICLGQRRYATAARQALDFSLATAVLAAPFGTIDWLALPSATRARRIGLWHGVGNAALLGLLATSRLLRARRDDSRAAKWLSAGGFLLAGVTGWLGAELVEHHRVGIPEGAREDESGEDARGSLPYSDEQPTLPGFRSEQAAEHARARE
jgi:uncharacterized membrane protein